MDSNGYFRGVDSILASRNEDNNSNRVYESSEGTYSSEGGGRRGSLSPSSTMSRQSSTSGTSPTNPTKRFDPFAPLDHPSIYNNPNNSGRTGREWNLESSTSNRSDQTSHLYPSTSLARENRPPSLYFPSNDSKPIEDSEVTSPAWPFSKTGSGMEHLLAPSSGMGPASPSMIHPSYADFDKPSSHPRVYSPLSAPPPPLPPQQLHSSIAVGNSESDSEDRVYSSATTSRSTGGSKTYQKAPPRYQTTTNRLQSTSQSQPHHSSQYSLGTHHLLSSRLSTKARIIKTFDSPTAWLLLYFSFNLGLTLFNKLVMQGFPFPWTLTGIQMLSGTIGTQIALSQGFFTQARLNTREILTMLAFSILYTVNIAVSNLSLHLVTVPFHQVVRAMTPLFTIVLSVVLLNKRHSRATYFALLPVIAGVVFATYGDYYFTTWGLILTLFGTLLAALKTIVTNRIQVGRLKLHPLDLLIRMSPLAFIQCVACAWYSGELERVRIYGATEMTRSKAIALVINGVIAFGLNVVSFTANKKTGPLTMTVAANVKQVLTIILAVIIFNLSLSPMNLFGITLTLAGGAFYAKVELQEKAKNAPTNLGSGSRNVTNVSEKK